MYTQLQLRDSARPPVNVASLGRMKEQGEKISSGASYPGPSRQPWPSRQGSPLA